MGLLGRIKTWIAEALGIQKTQKPYHRQVRMKFLPLRDGWEEKVGGKLEFVMEKEEIVRRTIEHIDKKREALGLDAYDPSKWGKSGDRRMPELLELPLEERIEAAYGANRVAAG